VLFCSPLCSLHGVSYLPVPGGPQHGEELALIARLSEAESGRTMEVFGSQPSVQVYTANYLYVGECRSLAVPVSWYCCRWMEEPYLVLSEVEGAVPSPGTRSPFVFR